MSLWATLTPCYWQVANVLGEGEGLVTVQDICQGSKVLSRDPRITGMCHRSPRTTQIQEEADGNTDCHQLVVSVTFQMKELSEAVLKVSMGACVNPRVCCVWNRGPCG